jgi:hypothetical protein
MITIKANWIKSVFFIFFSFVTISTVYSEGTPQAMPNATNGVALYVANGSASGPYRDAPAQNRVRFYIVNNATENLYFNVRAFDRATTPAQVQPYYRILTAAGVQVVAPTQITTGQQIATYAQAVAGPNIGGLVPAGYTPITFDPAANGEYYIELYVSADGGATATANQTTVFTLFDFTVATTSNTRFNGRVYSQAWSFITYNPATNVGQINNSLEGDFFAQTSDSTTVRIDFRDGFRPFAFVLYTNRYGAVNGSNWVNDRRSQNTGASAPNLPNGFPVFFNTPDAVVFPVSTVATAPQFSGRIYGCAPALYIPFSIDKAGDVAILLDLNGTAGFQAGTSDRYIYVFDAVVGRNVATWNGQDGLGNTVSTALNFNMTISIRRGRTNMPMFDAELNSNGVGVNGIAPSATTPRIYFDDALLANTASTACTGTGDNNNNNTGTGIANTDIGVASPGRAWDGPGSGNANPAPTGGGGSTTLTLNCDDYGNVRTINSWFWAYEVSSSVFVVSVPGCSNDGDPVAFATDVDDDNDGVTDLVESGGVDPAADGDSDGIPNYLDITPGAGLPAFADVNGDGVNDAYDADKDGVINSFDIDSDNDGIPDIREAGGTDANGDGRADGTTDVDGDGLIDTYDPTCNAGVGTCLGFTAGTTIANTDTDGDGVPNARDLDSDNDGITDLVEAGGVDTNGDGRIDGAFADGDNDGLHTTYDANDGGDAIQYRDTDGDGVPNSRDLDSDNDGIPDVLEAGGADTNNDGRIDTFTDTDGDGLSQTVDGDANNDGTAENTAGALIITGGDADSDGDPETYPRANADANGLPNPYDLDADGDGILDAREVGIIDTNNDGIANGTLGADGWSDDIDVQQVFNPANTDLGARPNYLDIDSDDDGIPDLIEAQATGSYVAPSGVDSDGDGIDNNYDNNDAAFAGNANNGLVPINTDGLGYPDYIDTDADNDDRNDRIEGWDTNGNGIIDGSEVAFAAGDADGDGLVDVYDNDDVNPVASNGTTPASYPDVTAPGGDRDWRQGIDSDGDGVVNSSDVDDDNDGIPDINECAGCSTDPFTNGSFEIPAVAAGSNQQVNQATVTGWSTTAADGLIEIWGTGFNGVPAAAGNAFVELNATQNSTLYQNICLNGGGAFVLWSFKHRGRSGTDQADFKIGTSLGNLIPQVTATDGNTAWGTYNGIYRAPAGVTDLLLAFSVVSTAGGNQSIGNFLDDIQITVIEDCDTDNDGIPNRVDLDADNDGITDLVEAGGVDTNGDGRIDGAFADSDGDGLHNTYDASTGGDAIINRDTDGDGVPNLRDLDSDNDGIPDVIEAGGADTNNDGRIDGFTDTDLDGLAQSVDGDANNDGTAESTANALLITGTDADSDGDPETYPRANADGNGLPNPYDLDADGDGILDARESGLTDSNGDGIVDGTTGPDGWSDPVDALANLNLLNTDGAAYANYLDIDSDNDGIVDNTEAQFTGGYLAPAGSDGDNDGIDDAYDNNDALFAGGVNNGIVPTVNIDSDALPDFLDVDSDNDGYPDRIEGHDSDGDNRPDVGSPALNGIPGAADIDGDGLLDGYDNNTSSPIATNTGLNGFSHPNVDGGTSERDWREVANADGDAVPNTTDVDDDNDGVRDVDESGGVDPLADADADGIPNYMDPVPGAGPAFVDTNNDGINDNYDSDRDGLINSLDSDSDNDGISDLVEAGGADANGDGRPDVTTDTDGDGLVNAFDPDNGGSFLANRDTDGDGIPNSRDADSDNDGLPDVYEAGGTDSNNDGILDAAGTDSDGDGLANAIDGDANNDGTAENTNGALIITGADVNGDGRGDSYPRANMDGGLAPDPYDLDSDGDGLLDVREAGFTDTDGDGVVDGALGPDGWSDPIDALGSINPTNTDGDARPDYRDIDSDNDGITDNIEGQPTTAYALPLGTDGDNDGIDDVYDNNDLAFAGGSNNGIVPNNHDGTDLPDYRDTDTDNDGVLDRLEGHDYNLNNLPDDDVTLTGVDTDNDGLDNKFDLDNTSAKPTSEGMSNGGSTTNPPSPGARGPLQKSNPANADRDWRNNATALPVDLVSFTGRKQGDVVVLNWQSANELRFKEYVVERSSGNSNFVAIGTVAARGGSANEYEFTDRSVPGDGKYFYRLRMVDADNSYKFSRQLIIHFNSAIEWTMQVTPNPVVDHMIIRLGAVTGGQSIIQVFNSEGRMVIRQHASVLRGDNELLVRNAGLLSKGSYTVIVEINGLRLSRQFIVR